MVPPAASVGGASVRSNQPRSRRNHRERKGRGRAGRGEGRRVACACARGARSARWRSPGGAARVVCRGWAWGALGAFGRRGHRGCRREGSPRPGALKRTLSLTNPIESMIGIVRKTQRNVKRWQTGDMPLEVDRRRDAPSRTTVPQDHRLQRPRRPRDAYRPRTRRTQPNTGGSYTRVGIIPIKSWNRRPRSSTTSGTTSLIRRAAAAVLRCPQ